MGTLRNLFFKTFRSSLNGVYTSFMQGSHCTYNVTLWLVRVKIGGMETEKSIHFFIFVDLYVAASNKKSLILP